MSNNTSTTPSPSFGCINVVTGHEQIGYIDRKGRMKYRTPLPWWKRMLGFKSYVNVFTDWYTVGAVDGHQSIVSTGLFTPTQFHSVPVRTVVQKRTNFYTHENQYRCQGVDGDWCSIDRVIYESSGRVVVV